MYPVRSHLNLARSVTRILEIMDRAMKAQQVATGPLPDDRGLSGDDAQNVVLNFPDKHKLLRLRLQPLRNLEGRLSSAPTQDLDGTTEIVYRCGPDIKELWADGVVQRVLKKTKAQSGHSSGL